MPPVTLHDTLAKKEKKRKNTSEDAEVVEPIKNTKNTNYYSGLHIEEPKPVKKSKKSKKIQESKPVEELKLSIAGLIILIIVNKAKKRRIRRARESQHEAESGAGKDEEEPAASSSDDAIQSTHVEATVAQAEPKSYALTPGAYDERDDNISELDLENDGTDKSDADKPDDGTRVAEAEDSKKNHNEILRHEIEKNKLAHAAAKKASSTYKDDIALFGGYACLILACYAQHGAR